MVIIQEALNNPKQQYDLDWVTKIHMTLPDGKNQNCSPLNINVKLLCGADLLESFAVPGLWKEEDVKKIV